MKAMIFYTVMPPEYEKKMEHMVGEQLLREALREEYGIRLEYEARSVGEHGKPFISSRPEIHYNISHSGKYVVCVVAPQEVGIDIQIHSAASNIKRILERTVPADLARQILDSTNTEKAFYTQWVLREAYVKWTGEGLSKDLRKINLEEGWYELLQIDSGYSMAVYGAKPMEIGWRQKDIRIQK